MYKTAIIGIGEIGYKMDKDPSRNSIWTHAKTYTIHMDTILKAACDNNKSTFADFKLNYPEVNTYNCVMRMFDNENIDILSVCTPTNSHLEIVKQVVSIESLKAIFIEKPMGGSVEEAHEIVKLCKDSGIILAVNYMRRWENKYRLIRSLIDNNSLGELYSITAYGCTALLTSTSHLIDIFLYYGGDIDWLIGRLQKDYIREVQGISDEGGFAFVKFKDGAFGFLKGVSKDPYNYMFEIDLLFSNGRATISKDGTKINIEEFILNYKSSGSEYKTLEKVESNKFKTTDNERMLDAVSDIIQSIKTGEAPHSDGLNAIEVHRFIQAIKDSDNQGNKIIYE